MNPKVDQFLSKASKWKVEMTMLRDIVLECGLEEDFKWMHPCYTSDGRNVVLIHGFKEYCALLLFKGVLLEDPHGILIRQTENVQEGRQIRFTGTAEIAARREIIKAYIRQAVEIERSGIRVGFKPTSAFNMPEEFQRVLEGDSCLKAAFGSLTPGRQRGYLLYFSAAKQPKTRESRIAKHIPKILAGKGLNE